MSQSIRVSAAASAVALAFVAAASAQQPQAPPPACVAPEFRAFDFWLGDWSVFNAQSGEQVGENLVAATHEGCAIRESWSGADGVRGESLTYFDPVDGKWRQRWVSSGYGGYALEIDGAAGEPGRMTLAGTLHFYSRRQATQLRITWMAHGGTKLVQTFETRDPETGEWKEWFKGNYVRK